MTRNRSGLSFFHLDAELEARIVAAIRTLSITRIVVAHRRETLEQVDRLIRLDLTQQS